MSGGKMGGSSSSVTVGYKYYVGMHMALCHGPIDKLVRIRVGGNKAWVGNNTGGPLAIDKPDLFGGEKREGGVTGQVDIEMGGPAQGQNSYLASKLGAALLPAFRGACCAVLRQCYIGLNPYPKDWAWLPQRIRVRDNGAEQWYVEKAAIGQYQVSDTILPFFEETITSFADFVLVVPDGSIDGVWTIGANGLTHNLDKQGDGSATATRTGVFTRAVSRVEFDFMLEQAVADRDSAVMRFLDEEGSVIFTFSPWDKDRSDRPTWNGANIGLTHLEEARSYHCTIEQVESSVICTILYIGEEVASASSGGSLSEIRSYQIENSLVEAVKPVVITAYNDIKVYQYISTPGEDVYGYYSDMNPAHIIRECLTDANWGLGYADGDIDDVSFTAAADTLFSEGMGISLLWSQQTSIEDFVEEIIRHIDAALYVDRSTGTFALKLIRGGYDESSLLVLDKSNISRVENYSKQTMAELANEVTLSYNSNDTDQIETVTLQNLAMIQQQGAIIPASVEYMGFANHSIASKVAARDLKAMSTPLVSATIYANRAAAGLNIGDVFVWDWTEQDEAGAGIATSYVMRVTELGFGDGVDNVVRISCVQDVFALPDITYVEAEPTVWENPSVAPLAASPRLVMETPYYEIVRQLGDLGAEAKLSGLPELGYLMVAAGRQANEINAELRIDAGAGYIDGGGLDFCPCALLDGGIGELDTTAAIKDGVDLDEFAAGSLAQIDDEIVVVESITAGVATIRRGCLDTMPAEHADGAALIIWDGYAASDDVEYVDSDELDVKILTATGQGPLAIASAPVDSVTMDQRALRPYPPADVKIDGNYFPTEIVADDLVGIIATWAHRHRTQQTGGTILGWTEASVGPETGVTYSARLVRTDTNVELDSETAISGTTVTFLPTYRGEVKLELWSVRDALESLSRYSHIFEYGDPPVITDPLWADVAFLIQAPLSGSSIVDAKGHTVTVQGGVAVSDALGYRTIYFDGNGDRLDVGGIGDFNFLHDGSSWTIEFIANPAAVATDDVILDTTRGSTSNRGIFIAYSSGKIRVFITRGVSSSYVIDAVLNHTFVAEELKTVCLEYDHSLTTGTLKMYVEGVLVASANKTANAPSTGDHYAMMIGMFHTSYPANAYTGHLRAIRATQGIRYGDEHIAPIWPLPTA